jgi:hypothetical protein
MNEKQNNASAYFTPEIESKIAAMGPQEMQEVLKAMVSTPAWIALLKYNQDRLRYVQGSLFYTDPVKEPTEIARTQGIMLGLSDFQNAVIGLISQGEGGEEEKEGSSE